MKLFLLPGATSQQQEWAERILPVFREVTTDIHLVTYDSTANGGTFSLNKETGALLDLLEDQEEPYGIFAASAGILVALEALAEAETPPEAMVAAGLPLTLADSMDVDLPEVLSLVDYPLLCIQQEHDPVGAAPDVRRIIAPVDQAECLILPGNSHDYPLVGTTKAATLDFFQDFI